MLGMKMSVLLFNENKHLKFHSVSKLQSDFCKVKNTWCILQVTFHHLTERSLTTIAQILTPQSINASVIFTRRRTSLSYLILTKFIQYCLLLFKAEFSLVLAAFSLYRAQKSKQRTKSSLAENPNLLLTLNCKITFRAHASTGKCPGKKRCCWDLPKDCKSLKLTTPFIRIQGTWL